MRGITLVFNIYIANKVGSETIGVFSLIMSIYTFAITVATSGLGISCTCIDSEEFAKGNYLNGIKAVKTGKFFALLLGIVAGVLIILFSPIISHFWLKDAVSPLPLYAIAIGLPFISISSVIGGYFSSVDKSYKSAIAQVLELTVKIIFTIFFLNFTISKGIEAICVSLILADVISEIFSFTLNSFPALVFILSPDFVESLILPYFGSDTELWLSQNLLLPAEYINVSSFLRIYVSQAVAHYFSAAETFHVKILSHALPV